MPPAIDKDAKIPCPTPQHLQAELDALAVVLEVVEKEDTWEKMERAIIRFTGVTRGGGYKHLPLYTDGIGKMGCGLKVAACMLSDRGRLSGVATELLQTLAPRLGHAFAPLVPVYLPTLVQLLGRPNKVFLKRAEKCLQTIITHCQLQSILVDLRKGLSDEAATCRRGCAVAFERAMLDWDKSIFGEKGVSAVEEALRKAGTDKDPEVRAIGKRIWSKYSEIWPERVNDFSDPLTPTIKRYLGVGAAAKPATAGPSRPKAARPAAASKPSAPVPEILSASSSANAGPIESIVPPRVQALGGGGKCVRAASASSITADTHNAVTKPRVSPVKAGLPVTFEVQVPSSLSGGPVSTASGSSSATVLPSEATRARLYSSRAPRYPPNALSAQSRSVSHSVLPVNTNPPSSFPSPAQSGPSTAIRFDPTSIDELIHSNQPSHPSRPNLPSSFSTVSLPGDSFDQFQANRRFAPPARPVRSTTDDNVGDPMDLYASQSGTNHYNPVTPHALRGAVRPTAGAVVVGRRPMGQAQRRVVTAPIPALPPPPEVEYTPAPQTALKTSQTSSVRQLVEEAERRQRDILDAVSVPLPISPVGGTKPPGGANKVQVNSEDRDRSTTPASPTVKVETDAHSPLMPVLARSLTSSAHVEGDLLGEETPMEEADVTINPPVTLGIKSAADKGTALGLTSPMESNAAPMQNVPQPSAKVEPPHPEDMDVTAVAPEVVSQTLPVAAITAKDAPAVASISEPTIPPMAPPASGESCNDSPANAVSGPSAPLAAVKTKPSALPPVTARSRPGPAKTAMGPPAPPPIKASLPKLPPASKPVKPRIPSAETRKPFRPTAKATAAGVPSSSAVPDTTSAVGSRSAASSAPVHKGDQVKAALNSSSSQKTTGNVAKAAEATQITAAKPGSATTAPARPPIISRTVSTSSTSGAGGPKSTASTLTKPTAASAHRSATAAQSVRASKPTVASSMSTAALAASIPLPPVRVPKARRKAPMESFRPVRSVTAETEKAKLIATNLKASTSSLSASTGAGKGKVDGTVMAKVKSGGVVAKVKVRPENIALPPSPGDDRANEIPLPPSPVKEEFKGKVKVRPHNVDLSASMGRTPSSISERSGVSQESGSTGLEAVGVASVAGSASFAANLGVEVLLDRVPSPAVEDLPTQSIDHQGTPDIQRAKLNALGLPVPRVEMTPYSKASTAPPQSDWLDSESEDEEPEGDYFNRKRLSNGLDTEEEQEEVEYKEGHRSARKIHPLAARIGRMSFGHDDVLRGSASTNASMDDATPGSGTLETVVIDLSAPSRRTAPAAEGLENIVPQIMVVGDGDGTILEKAIVVSNGLGKSPPSSPRAVLSERNRNEISAGVLG